MRSGSNARFVSPLDLLLYFRSLGMGGSIANADLATLAYESEEVFVRAGTLLLAGDQPVEKVFILVEGRLEIDAGEYTEVVEPPVGVNWLRLHGQYGTNRPVRALTDCLLLQIDASRMLDLLDRNPRTAESTVRAYADHLLRLREGLPAHPDAKREPADPGSPPARSLSLVERLRQATGPGAIWENANLDAVLGIVWAMEEVKFQRGDVLWSIGDRSPLVWRLVCGTVACTNAAGRSVEVGAGFGLAVNSSLTGAPRTFSAVATHDGVALRSNMDEMLALVENHADMRHSMLAVVARALSDEFDADHVRRKKTGAPALGAIGTHSGLYGARAEPHPEEVTGKDTGSSR